MNDHIPKPLDFDSMLAKLIQYLPRKKRKPGVNAAANGV
jgi:hypothetical protein